MTDDPRYSNPQQPGQSVPNQQGAPGYSQSGYQQPYDWRYGSAHQQAHQQPYDPYRSARAGSTAVLPPVNDKPRRKRSRTVALTAGALTIAAVSAGIGGAVASMVHSEDHPAATANTTVLSAPDRSAVPTANVPVGSVEQVAAKVVPSVVKLETKMGRASEEGSGIILSADGLILTNNHVVAAVQGGPPGAPKLPGPLTPAPTKPGAPSADPAAGSPKTLVTFADGRTATFTVVGTDPASDIAVVRAQGVSGLTPITLGSSASRG